VYWHVTALGAKCDGDRAVVVPVRAETVKNRIAATREAGRGKSRAGGVDGGCGGRIAEHERCGNLVPSARRGEEG